MQLCTLSSRTVTLSMLFSAAFIAIALYTTKWHSAVPYGLQYIASTALTVGHIFGKLRKRFLTSTDRDTYMTDLRWFTFIDFQERHPTKTRSEVHGQRFQHFWDQQSLLTALYNPSILLKNCVIRAFRNDVLYAPLLNTVRSSVPNALGTRLHPCSWQQETKNPMLLKHHPAITC